MQPSSHHKVFLSSVSTAVIERVTAQTVVTAGSPFVSTLQAAVDACSVSGTSGDDKDATNVSCGWIDTSGSCHHILHSLP